MLYLDDEPLLSREQLAKRLNICVRTLDRMAKRGDLIPSTRVGRQWRYSWSHVAQQLDAAPKMAQALVCSVERRAPVDYEAYLASEVWQEKRQQRLEIDGHECRLCGCREDLEVHHKPGSYAKIPDESAEDDLTTLCIHCHRRLRDAKRKQDVPGGKHA